MAESRYYCDMCTLTLTISTTVATSSHRSQKLGHENKQERRQGKARRTSKPSASKFLCPEFGEATISRLRMLFAVARKLGFDDNRAMSESPVVVAFVDDVVAKAF